MLPEGALDELAQIERDVLRDIWGYQEPGTALELQDIGDLLLYLSSDSTIRVALDDTTGHYLKIVAYGPGNRSVRWRKYVLSVSPEDASRLGEALERGPQKVAEDARGRLRRAILALVEKGPLTRPEKED